jgi:hypothetical protein
MRFIEKLISEIVKNKDMPKVQVEREIGPIIEIFIVEFINKLAEEKIKSLVKGRNELILEEGCYELIAPEFPLQSESIIDDKQTNRSTNIDYLMYNKDTQTLYLIELKTDSSSFKLEQHRIYKRVIDKIDKQGAGYLYDFLENLSNKKYKKYKDDVVDDNMSGKKKAWQDIKKAKLIYLAPGRLAKDNPRRGDSGQEAIDEINFIHFEHLYQHRDIDHKYRDEWQIITKHLRALDLN